MKLLDDFPHINFKKSWEISEKGQYIFGQCNSIISAISYAPIQPEYRQSLLYLSLIKGAQATTAIEGNALSIEEIKKIEAGQSVEPSKKYQEQEVKNILDAFNEILKTVIYKNKDSLINPDLIKHFHYMVGKDLGEMFDAIPGRFRSDSRFVGPYKAPDHIYVPDLIDNLCHWLQSEFHYVSGQSFIDSIIQAIVSHVYIEWIHPFADGNGRTGRLIEFYLLMRSGLPDIASHILSNHYNETRSKYYYELNMASKTRSLTSFIDYAIEGFLDGLNNTLNIIQENQLNVFWQKLIYDIFSEKKYGSSIVFKRRRKFMLNVPLLVPFSINDIIKSNVEIALLYNNLSQKTIDRDLKEFENLGLLKKEGMQYQANTDKLFSCIPRRKITEPKSG